MKTHTLAFLAVLGLVAVIGTLNPWDAQTQAKAQADCKKNVRDLGTALEMYSCDHSGYYPEKFENLMPLYIKELPVCPAAGEQTYLLEVGNDPKRKHSTGYDEFNVRCAGKNHASLPADKPSYDSRTGYSEGP